MLVELKKRMALDLIQSLDDGDVDMAISLISEDFHSEFMQGPSDPADGGMVLRLDRNRFTSEGVPLIRAFTRDGMNFSIEDVVCEGDIVVVFGRSDGTMRDGRPYRNVYAWRFAFSGDRIVEMREYCDTSRARELLASGN